MMTRNRDPVFPFACLLLLGTVARAQVPRPGAPQPQLPIVRLIATGGTIAMKIDPEKKAPVPAISGEDLIATVPEIAKVARVRCKTFPTFPLIIWTPSAGRSSRAP